ncbi:MAG TPA: tetratricopeptide repeat protein [Ferruginibacter sp.]|nr:tetratricopeptide repeat protein [Ferruginibacter sp.]
MLQKIFFSLLLSVLAFICGAQSDPRQLHETAKTFMRQGDYANAILVLNRGLQQDPQNIEMAKDLGMSYYFQKDNSKALEVIKPLLDRDDANDQLFQIAGNIYKQLDMPKDAEKNYKKGLKKFPSSGPLYNEYGEILWSQKEYQDAISQWEKGIEAEPSYSRNYYNAAKYYFFTPDKVWSILYGEIFINMEPLGTKTPEIKQLLLDSYKKLYTDPNLEQGNKDENRFVKAFLQKMNRQSAIAESGLTAETLTMIRTRFILDWYNDDSNKPYKLFEYQRQLLKEGMFDAYNQWIFGSVQNLSTYQNWSVAHASEYNEFNTFQKGRIFKIPAGQNYK